MSLTNKLVEKRVEDCEGSGSVGARVYQFPIQTLLKKNDPPELELIEGGKKEATLKQTPGVYDHRLLGTGHHKGKPWEIAAAVREKLGLPAEERILFPMQREVTYADGRRAIVQMTNRAFEKMQKEHQEELNRKLRIPGDIGEHDY